VRSIDRQRHFVSEASVYPLLKARGEPARRVQHRGVASRRRTGAGASLAFCSPACVKRRTRRRGWRDGFRGSLGSWTCWMTARRATRCTDSRNALNRIRLWSRGRDARFGAYAALPKRACLRAALRVPVALPTPCTSHEPAPLARWLDQIAAARAIRALVGGVEWIGDAPAPNSRFSCGQGRRWLGALASRNLQRGRWR